MAHGPPDGSIQFLGINVAAFASCLPTFDLHFLPYGLADDTGMPVLRIVLRRFTLIRFAGFRQEINGDLLLQDRISHIFFVFQNAANGF